MKTIFVTESEKHLHTPTNIQLTKFKDKEFKLKILEQVKRKHVVVISSFFPPAENLLELLFLLETLRRCKAKIHLIIPYFGYARQDRVAEIGESFGGKVICEIINKYKPKSVHTVCIHSSRLRKYLKFKDYIPLEIFKPELSKLRNIKIVAPDAGAKHMADSLANLLNTEASYLVKTRPSPDQAKIIEVKDGVDGKNIVIIDDIISTGGTLIESAKVLKKQGAKDIYVCAFHGLFSGDAIKNLEKSPIKKIFVSNTVPIKSKSRKIKVIKADSVISGIINKL